MNHDRPSDPIPDSERNSVVAVYEAHDAADAAVRALRDAGVDPTKLSVVGRGVHTEDQVVGFYNRGREIRHWGSYGALWGGLWGWLVSGLFWVPGVGHVTAAGWIVWNLASAAGGAALGGGIGVIAAALKDVGVPDDVVPQYESALKADHYLVVVHGAAPDVESARRVLDDTAAARVDMYIRTSTAR
jgi:uncharacterized membrane protein